MCQVLDHLMWPVGHTQQSHQLSPEIASCCCCSVAQLCPTLCDPIDCSIPGFLVLHHLLELAQTHVHWVSDAMLLLLLLSCLSCVWLCATPQTAAHQAPPPLGFSRQEHWSGLPFPSPMHESEKWKWGCSVVSDSSGVPEPSLWWCHRRTNVYIHLFV